jgi:ABC-2 type transport system permease protein
LVARKIFRLWAQYARMDMLWLLKDSQNFVMYTATDIVISLASITGVWLLAEKFSGIGGLTVDQILFMLGYSMAANGIINTFLSGNIYHISRRIGRGQMDHVLIMPQPVWMSLFTEGFFPVSGSGTLLAGAGLLSFSLSKLDISVSPALIVFLAVCLFLSVAINASFSFLWGSLAFYSPLGAEEVCTSVDNLFTSLRSFPLNGVGMLGKSVMLSVLPVGLYAWFPSMALIGVIPRWNVAVLAAISAAYLALVVFIFGTGLQHYVKTGCNRYTDGGHRR